MSQDFKPITHSELVSNLKKPGQDIALELNSNSTNMMLLIETSLHVMAVLKALDLAKKQSIYNKDLGYHPQWQIPEDDDSFQLTPQQADMLHMVVGVVGEAGELLEAVLAHIVDKQNIDTENIIEELGDTEFYLEGFRQILDISRDKTIHENVAKLGVRYSSGNYSDNQAQSRADKQ